MYLVGARVDGGIGRGWALRLGVHTATFLFGLLGLVLSPQQFIWVMCGWIVLCGYIATIGGRTARAYIRRPVGNATGS